MQNSKGAKLIFLIFVLAISMLLMFPVNIDNIYFWGIFYTIFGLAAIYYTFVKRNIFDSVFSEYRDKISDKISTIFNKGKVDVEGKAYKLTKGFFNITEAVFVVLFVQMFFIGHVKVPTASMFPIIKPGDHYVTNMIFNKFVGFKRGGIYYFQNPDENKNKFLCKRLVALPGEEVSIKDNKVHIDGKAIDWDIEHYTILKRGAMVKDTLLSDNIWLVPKKGDKLTLKDIILKVRDGNRWVYKDLDSSIRQYKVDGDKFIGDILEIESIDIVINNRHKTGIILDGDVLKDLLTKKETILKEDYYFFLGDNSHNSSDSRVSGFVGKSKIRGSLFFRIWPPNRWKLELL